MGVWGVWEVWAIGVMIPHPNLTLNRNPNQPDGVVECWSNGALSSLWSFGTLMSLRTLHAENSDFLEGGRPCRRGMTLDCLCGDGDPSPSRARIQILASKVRTLQPTKKIRRFFWYVAQTLV